MTQSLNHPPTNKPDKIKDKAKHQAASASPGQPSPCNQLKPRHYKLIQALADKYHLTLDKILPMEHGYRNKIVPLKLKTAIKLGIKLKSGTLPNAHQSTAKSIKVKTDRLCFILFKREPQTLARVKRANTVSLALAQQGYPTRIALPRLKKPNQLEQPITSKAQSLAARIVRISYASQPDHVSGHTNSLNHAQDRAEPSSHPSKLSPTSTHVALHTTNRTQNQVSSAQQTSTPAQAYAASHTRYACLYQYLPGSTITWDGYTRKHLKLLGQTMSRLHQGLQLALPSQPVQTMLAASTATHFPTANNILRSHLRQMLAYFTQPAVQQAAQAKLKLKIDCAQLGRYRRLLKLIDKPPQQLLHFDFVRSNILFTSFSGSKLQQARWQHLQPFALDFPAKPSSLPSSLPNSTTKQSRGQDRGWGQDRDLDRGQSRSRSLDQGRDPHQGQGRNQGQNQGRLNYAPHSNQPARSAHPTPSNHHSTQNYLTISGILDLEKVCLGPKIIDLARTLAFLLVDSKHKQPQQIRKYFLHSGYRKRGPESLPHLKLLNPLLNLFWVYDLYKFMKHNPYQYLGQNQHYQQTKQLLSQHSRLVTKVD